MAIGFVGSGKLFTPDKTLARNQTPRVRRQQFGDGYEQRLAEGINNVVESFQVTFVNKPKIDADDLAAFFETQGGVTAFDFTYPDTNSTSTTTAQLSSAPSSSLTLAITQANLDISVGATVTGTGVDGTPKVTENQSPTATIIVDTLQTIDNSTVLTFTHSNERTVKVVCENWTINYSNSDHYSIQTQFRRVYEP